MKKQILFSVLVLLSFCIYGQQPSTLEDSDLGEKIFARANFPRIKGKLLNYDPEVHKDLRIQYSAVQLAPEIQKSKVASINSDGSFELEASYGYFYQEIWLIIENRYFGRILAQKDLLIEADLALLDGKDLNWYGEGIKFLGTDGPINVFANKYIQFKDSVSKARRASLKEQDTQEVRLLLKEGSEKAKEIQALYLKEADNSFAWLLENDRLSKYYENLCRMNFGQDLSPELWEEIINFQPKIISNESALFYKSIAMMLNGGKMNGFLEKIKSFPAQKSALVKLVSQPEDIYHRQKYFNQILPEMEDHWARDLMREEQLADEKKIAQIEKSIQNSPEEIEVNLLGMKILEIGEEITLYHSVKDTPRELIEDLKKHFKGKALILDVWTTWCGPCLYDMNQSKAIKEEMKSLPVEIVYLHIDDRSSEESWKKKVAELEVAGTHIFLNQEQGADLMDYFQFRGYPSYAFIDKEGKVDLDFVVMIWQINLENLKKKL
ncbi:MAG: TlpA disulfide reductase family protein [Bacteroidota bacterium]